MNISTFFPICLCTFSLPCAQTTATSANTTDFSIKFCSFTFKFEKIAQSAWLFRIVGAFVCKSVKKTENPKYNNTAGNRNSTDLHLNMSSAANSPATNSNSDDEQSRSKWHLQLNADTPPPNSNTPLSTPTSLHSSAGGVSGGASKRKSAFLPYRPHATVLTNLQRGNTEATFCPVEVALSFHERAGQGEITDDQVRIEFERNARNIDFKDATGFTALHWASYYGQLAAVRLLVDSGADVNAEAPEMVTPLLLAACGGHNEVVRLLLEHGARPTHMDIVGNTALMYAAAGNHPHTCNELLAKDPDMTATNENGDTAYSLAVENGAVLAQAVLEQYLSALLLL